MSPQSKVLLRNRSNEFSKATAFRSHANDQRRRRGDPWQARARGLSAISRNLMGAPLRWRAVIASAQGKTDEAIRHLDAAVRQGFRLLDNPPNLTVHLDRDFVGIEKTTAYKGMVQSLTDASAANMTSK